MAIKKRPIQIYLEDRQHRVLREIARRRDVSLACLLREGADRVIEEALPPDADPLMELPELAAAARIFVDTGGWIALLSHADSHHAHASAAWPGILRRFHQVVVTNLVIAESHTFLRREVGFAPAWALLDRLQATPRLALVYADAELEGDARSLLRQYRDQEFAYTDAVSLVTMKRRGIKHAFGFDRRFLTAGFELIPAGRTSG